MKLVKLWAYTCYKLYFLHSNAAAWNSQALIGNVISKACLLSNRTDIHVTTAEWEERVLLTKQQRQFQSLICQAEHYDAELSFPLRSQNMSTTVYGLTKRQLFGLAIMQCTTQGR